LCADDHIRPFDLSGLARQADLDHGLGIADIREIFSSCHYVGIRFSNNPRSWWDSDCGRDFVETGINEQDLVLANRGGNGLIQSIGVIGLTITLGAKVSGADKLGDWNRLILGL
jgi:hypothetical protein